MAKRINVQLSKLKQKNPNAFMFIDEPGMQFVFSAMSGYGEQKAKQDLDLFFSAIDRPRGIHLCGNPDWDFLLGLDMDILSLDIYTNADIFGASTRSVKRFLDRGGILVWGIVPQTKASARPPQTGPMTAPMKATAEAGSAGPWPCPRRLTRM